MTKMVPGVPSAHDERFKEGHAVSDQQKLTYEGFLRVRLVRNHAESWLTIEDAGDSPNRLVIKLEPENANEIALTIGRWAQYRYTAPVGNTNAQGKGTQ